jgi:hypothetical protein
MEDILLLQFAVATCRLQKAVEGNDGNEEFIKKRTRPRALLNSIRKMWIEVLRKIERETGLTSAELSGYYVEKVLHQS